MDNIRNTLRTIFQETDPERILKDIHKIYDNEDKFRKDCFPYQLSNINNNQSLDECKAVYEIYESEWEKEGHKLAYGSESKSVFNVLSAFTNKVFVQEGGELLCKYQHILRWREISLTLGEDIFTTSYFASSDLVSSINNRNDFSWKPILSTNNKILKQILNKGLTDLHFHLKGSSFHFELSWLSLMNNIENRQAEFKSIDRFLMTRTAYDSSRSNRELYFLVIKAAAIRMYLFYEIQNIEKPEKFKNIFSKILESENENEIKIFQYSLQNYISAEKYLNAFSFEGKVIDYCLDSSIAISKNDYFGSCFNSGERYFMYSVFKTIFKSFKDTLYIQKLFHVYLLIKERLRSELIQVNKKVGFDNFAKYQDRKSMFIEYDSVYDILLHSLAINNSLTHQNISNIEARIAPKGSEEELVKQIEKTDKFISYGDLRMNKSDVRIRNYDNYDFFKKDLPNISKYLYTYHFIKEPDGGYKGIKNEVLSRNYNTRKTVKEQSLAINNLRKRNNGVRFNGIDAANSEIGCRPEVFAQAYRYLKNYSYLPEISFIDFTNLGFTFHAGEDFLDIVDGLRAIDEVLNFLDYRSGDRLGHALALGIDPKEYYMSKSKHICLSKHDLLDNLVWMYIFIGKHVHGNYRNLCFEIKQECNKLYSEIYNKDLLGQDLDSFDMSVYFDAYCLRGDNPKIYLNLTSGDNYDVDKRLKPLSFWKRVGLNYNELAVVARKRKKARLLYYNYHYNHSVKEQGKVHTEYKITDDYINAVKDIQDAMMNILSVKQISIEVNPSSNQVIGTYNRYSNHPIVRFFNLGLTYNERELKKCPQLSVSINTDDQGVFSTSIENEYALMATSLAKEMDENNESKYVDRMVYDWLERIRIMGHEQKF